MRLGDISLAAEVPPMEVSSPYFIHVHHMGLLGWSRSAVRRLQASTSSRLLRSEAWARRYRPTQSVRFTTLEALSLTSVRARTPRRSTRGVATAGPQRSSRTTRFR